MNHLLKKRWWGFVALVVLLAFSFPLMAAEPVIVGVVHREDFAYATMMRNAYEMALETINAENGAKGRPLELAFADDRGDPESGKQAIRELVQEKNAVMLVGGYSSSNTLQMAYAADALNIPFLVCTAADDRITQYNLKNIYRLNPPVSEYTRGLEEFLLERIKPQSMSILYENSPFGTGSAMQMMWFCRENDIVIKSIQPYFKQRATPEDLQRMLIPLQENPPEVIFMASYLDDAALLVNKISQLKINALLSGGAGGFTHTDFLRKTGNASEYMLTATLWSPSGSDSQARDFSERFSKRYSVQPDYHAAEAYSALLVAVAALRQSPSLDPAEIRRALDATSVKTPFGEVAFEDYGPFQRQNVSKTQVFQILKGQFETVWPDQLATAEFTTPAK